jgi:hypothetical protein
MLTQAQLERKVEVFTTNGKKPEAQAVISKVGYTPVKLDEHATLLAAIRQGHSTVPDALKAQKQATDAEAVAREAANKEIASLSDTCRIVYANDEPTLTALGLTTQHETVKGPDGQPTGTVAARQSEATAELIKRWRARVDIAAQLAPDKAALLDAAGWSAARVTAAQALVEAFAKADTDQQAAIQTYQQLSDKQTADIDALRAWYTTAAALSKRAIKDADPDNHQQLLELLEL